MGEQALHRCRQTKLDSQHLRHLADSGQVAPAPTRELRQSARDTNGAHQRRAIPIDQRAHGPGHGLDRRPEHDRVEMPDQGTLIREHLRADLSIGCTADVEQKTGVVRLRCGFSIDPQPLAEPHREQGAL